MMSTFTIAPHGNKPYHTGTAIPVFALRSTHSAGVGQFSDLKPLADFLHQSGMDVIQLLPINDTTTFMDWRDSYPYRAISVFALHPIYLDIEPFLADLSKADQAAYREEQVALNALDMVDYERSLALKLRFAALIYKVVGEKIAKGKDFQDFCSTHDFWLKPYAAFSYLRDLYKTSVFTTWPSYKTYSESVFAALSADKAAAEALKLSIFIQYLLHQQLEEAVDYCHSLGIAVKGDIAIGIAHDSADAWADPAFFHMDLAAGAPPDVFSTIGQNWGFPTYDWEAMKKDGYHWWQERMQSMNEYFDAYRLDHILGFFRIWEIPQTSIRGLLGHFSPALALSAEEIENNYGIPFRQWGVARFTQPFIRDWVIDEVFGRDARDRIIQQYLTYVGDGSYAFQSAYEDERKINQKAQEADKDGLYRLYENVIFVEDHQNKELYHPRIKLFETSSYREFGDEYKSRLYNLYTDYFYRRNYKFWEEEAYQKLPAVKDVTQMLACGEDLGMVPENVPDVMYHLNILRLIIERMPSDAHDFVANLAYAPYLSVVTTSSHDTSTLRGWWQEDHGATQRYYNEVMHWNGEAPWEASPEIIQEIIKRHLDTDAMLVILPLQDWLAMTQDFRREDVDAERINRPDIPFHYWRYRMHLPLEALAEDKGLTGFLSDFIASTKRAAVVEK